jgi:hypothetical protein
MHATVFNREIVGAMTHYTGARTQLCTAPDCQACRDHQEPRWYGYMAVYNPKTLARAILEIPKGPILSFNDYLKSYRDLRGARLTLYRRPQRANGGVYVDLAPPDPLLLKYPDEIDLFRHLCQLWRLSHISQLEDYNASNLQNGPALPKQWQKTPADHNPNADETIRLYGPDRHPHPFLPRYYTNKNGPNPTTLR